MRRQRGCLPAGRSRPKAGFNLGGFERRRLSQVFRDVVGANVDDVSSSKPGDTLTTAEAVR